MGLSQPGGAEFRTKGLKSREKAVISDDCLSQVEETGAELLIREYFQQQEKTGF